MLEAGIEIVAQPPGKRLQNISLLSTGEKSLAAVALIFAILRYKPAPFYLLDEVESSLDDINPVSYTHLAPNGINLVVIPAFVEIKISGEERTALKFIVEPR